MTFAEYLASINWGAALVVGVASVAVGLVLLRFMTASTSEIGSMIPGATESAARMLDARELPVDSWVCAACRSVNRPTATYCYRGCGTRDELARDLPVDPDMLGSVVNGRRI
jgi:hypothetical protein